MKFLFTTSQLSSIMRYQMYLGNIHPIGISRALGIPKTSAYRQVSKVRALAQKFYQEMI